MNLRFNASTKRRIGELLFDRINFKAGVESAFIPLTATTGIKLFYQKRSRNYAHKKQQIAAKNDIGPKVGDKFELHFIHGSDEFFFKRTTVYCYLTERADRVGTPPTNVLICKAKAILNTDGLDFIENHTNVGQIKGKTVILDFGPATIGETTTDTTDDSSEQLPHRN